MREANGLAIVAVDAGYGNMKTASCLFPAGLIAHDEKPYFTDNLLEYGGRWYTIGEGHKEYTPDKIMDEDYYLLTLAAIARELSRKGVTRAKMLLAAGLPLTWIVSQQKAYREYLLRNKEVAFTFCGREYHIEIADAMIFPQGYAAIADRLGEFKGVNIVADIGNGTVNLLRVVDRRADPKTMVTEAVGVKDCIAAMRTALANKHSGAKVDDSILERIIRTGAARIDAAYLATLQEAARSYTRSLFRLFREYGYDAKTTRLYAVGGGSCLIRNFSGDTSVVINGDIHANAKGYEWLAYERLRKRT